MTYASKETSRQNGAPITLYTFSVLTFYNSSFGSTMYRYTDAPVDVVSPASGSPVHKATPIIRNEITASGGLDKSALEIRLPVSSEIGQLVRDSAFGNPIAIKIEQMHETDPDREIKVVWIGRTVATGEEEDEFVMSCEPVATSLQRVMLRRNYQYQCPHAFAAGQVPFGGSGNSGNPLRPVRGCPVGTGSTYPLRYTRDLMPVAVRKNEIELPADWFTGDPLASNPYVTASKFSNGYIALRNLQSGQSGVQYLTILSVVGNVLKIASPPQWLSGSLRVNVVLGCNKTMGDCHNIYNALTHFGGMPYIPSKNPHETSNNMGY